MSFYYRLELTSSFNSEKILKLTLIEEVKLECLITALLRKNKMLERGLWQIPSNQKSKDMPVLNIHCWRPCRVLRKLGTRPTGTLQFAGD